MVHKSKNWYERRRMSSVVQARLASFQHLEADPMPVPQVGYDRSYVGEYHVLLRRGLFSHGYLVRGNLCDLEWMQPGRDLPGGPSTFGWDEVIAWKRR